VTAAAVLALPLAASASPLESSRGEIFGSSGGRVEYHTSNRLQVGALEAAELDGSSTGMPKNP